MMAGSYYFIGISARTNETGVDQLIDILEKYSMTGSKVPLKTGVNYLENNNLLKLLLSTIKRDAGQASMTESSFPLVVNLSYRRIPT